MTATSNDSSSSERRGRTRDLIDRLLEERRQLLSLLVDSSSSDPAPQTAGTGQLKEFCEALVDYIAAGHFGLYQRLSEGTERRSRVIDIAHQVYPEIESITQSAVTFSDNCDANQYQRTDQVMVDLSKLAERLSTRFELEDKVIHGMLH